MNKEYYNNCIKQFIKELMEEKESIVEDITIISTHLKEFKSETQDLSKYDINSINEQRNNLGAIYELISDLDKLLK